MTQAESPAKQAVSLDQIVEKYIQLRDKKAELDAAHKKEVAKYDEAMTRIENFLLKHLQDSGAESVRTAHGTAYKSTKTSATVADWDQTLDWIKANEEWSMLEKRVSKAFVEAYQEAHNDLPPGVNWRSEVAVNIRRS